MEPNLYTPRFNAMAEGHRDFVTRVGAATLITVGADGLPDATLLPVLWRDDSLAGHLAIANPHWRRIPARGPGLAVVTGPDAYVSPSWYAAKAEHGRVVPTWNYSVVQLRGSVRVIREKAWLRRLVEDLTDEHEAGFDAPWAVTDAPDSFIEQQLKAIVGVELTVESVEAKAKLSQNRSEADRAGVVRGLSGRDARSSAVAEEMRQEARARSE